MKEAIKILEYRKNELDKMKNLNDLSCACLGVLQKEYSEIQDGIDKLKEPTGIFDDWLNVWKRDVKKLKKEDRKERIKDIKELAACYKHYPGETILNSLFVAIEGL